MIKNILKKIIAVIKEFLLRIFFFSLLLTTIIFCFVKLWQWQKQNLLLTREKEVIEMLKETKEQARQSDNLSIGVAFADGEYTVFKTQSDWERRLVQEDEIYKLTKTLHFANHNLIQDCNNFRSGCVVFKAGSGDVVRINEKQEFNIVIYDDDTNEERLIEVW